MAINNPLIPGDPFSYDLKWLVRKIKEHSASILQILETMPDDDHIKDLIQQMIDSGEIDTRMLASLGIYNVRDYGAKGDQTTDDHDAIMAAYDAASANNGILYFPEGMYLTESSLMMENPVHVFMVGTIYHEQAGPAVVVGNTETYKYKHQSWRIQGLDGQNPGSIGLYLKNCNECGITLDYISGFEKAVICSANNTHGFQNNVVYINDVSQFTVGITLRSDDTVSWVNENLFIGGRIWNNTSSLWTAYAFQLGETYQTHYCNNNVFLKPNIEVTHCGFNIVRAASNRFIYYRCEGVSNVAIIDPSCENNEFLTGWGSEPTVDARQYYRPYRKFVDLQRTPTQIRLDDMAFHSAGSGSEWSIENMFYLDGSGGLLETLPSAGNYSGEGTMIQANQAAVFRLTVYPLDTSRMVHFNFKSSGGRAAFKFFDTNGTEITTFDEFQSQTAGTGTVGSDTVNTFGNKKDGYNIIIPATCTEMWIGIYATSNIYVESFCIFTDAVINMIEHKPELASAPTRNGKHVGQTVYKKTGGGGWRWNGSAWASFT